jgi:solute carrier family 6 amino acid transporter-like protein 5/7/9/14
MKKIIKKSKENGQIGEATEGSSVTTEEETKDSEANGQVIEVSGGSITIENPELSSAEERGKWGSPIEFILSCLGYAVGLGNVWRFPYLVYSNGGGAFIIPYVLMLVFVGLPLFFMELIVGQYVAAGPMKVWSISPLFLGIGAGMQMINFISSIYYNMLMGWSLYYLFASWQKELPWSDCKHEYNTPYCYTKREAQDCEDYSGTWFNLTCYNATEVREFDNYTACYNDSQSTTPIANCTPYNWLEEAVLRRRGASEEYYNYKVLDISPSIDEPGYLKWDLCLALLGAWVICCLCLIKGIKSSGKVVYVTATFPYVILIILCIRGAILPGAIEGVKFYIIPDWSQLGHPKVWADAAGQVFFSLSVGMGGLMTFASYNPFHNNVYRDTLIVVISDAFTSIFAGFAIFSILGHLAYVLNTSVDKVVVSGSGLAFIAYPEVCTYLEPPQLWATLFFLMLITLGIDTQFAGIETIMTGIVDHFPRLRTKKMFVSTGICVVMYLLGLTMCTRAGVYWLELMSYYSSGWSLILIAIAEAIVFAWFYGASRIIADVQLMCGFRLYPHWWFCWTFITPLLLVAILIFNMIDFTPLSYGDYLLPPWSQAVGWLMAIASVALIPIFAVYQIWKSYQHPEYDNLNFFQRLFKLTQATPQWLPADKAAREVLANRSKAITKESFKLPEKPPVTLTHMTSVIPYAYSGGTDQNVYSKMDDEKAVSGHNNLCFEYDDSPTKMEPHKFESVEF